MGCAASVNREGEDASEISDEPEPEQKQPESKSNLSVGPHKNWKRVESGIGPRALGMTPRKDRVLHAVDDENDLMSYDATEVENARKRGGGRDPTSLRGMEDDDSESEERPEEVGNTVYSGMCMAENYLSDWKVEIQYFMQAGTTQLALTSETEKHKLFPEVIPLSDVKECTLDQTKVTIRFSKSRLVLFFHETTESGRFIQHFPSHLTCRLLFSEVAIYCKKQKKALVQLVTYGKQKRFIKKRHGAALLIKTEKQELVHPIHSSTECSSQVRLVAIDEHSKEPRLLQFVTVGMAQTFIRKFSEIIHDLYAVNHILLYSGIVSHNKKTKRIELRQFDDGSSVLSIFLRKEPTITFNELPIYRRKNLELRLRDSKSPEVSLFFRTEGEIKVFTQYLSPGME